MARSRSGSSCPSSAARAIAWPVDALRLEAGERIDRKQRPGRGERFEFAAGQREDLAVGGRQTPPHRGCLGSVSALAEDRPGGSLVRRVEQHRPEPRELRLETPDHRITTSNRSPRCTGLIQRQHSPQLGEDHVRRGLAEEPAVQYPPRVLGDEGRGVMLEVVGDEGQ